MLRHRGHGALSAIWWRVNSPETSGLQQGRVNTANPANSGNNHTKIHTHTCKRKTKSTEESHSNRWAHKKKAALTLHASSPRQTSSRTRPRRRPQPTEWLQPRGEHLLTAKHHTHTHTHTTPVQLTHCCLLLWLIWSSLAGDDRKMVTLPAGEPGASQLPSL